MPEHMRIIVTGAAGFIGSHAVKALLKSGHSVLAIDNLNDYYDSKLKNDRLENIGKSNSFEFEKVDISDHIKINKLFDNYKPMRVLHLAAQAGVRFSIENPFSYIESNLKGHLSILEAVRSSASVQHLVYASSSSVYGNDTDVPFSENARADKPASLYAATKRADELMSESYSSLYKIPQTGLRFFTVYGPWGRPDMAYWLFAEAILDGRPIKVFNEGRMARDFTHVDDVVESLSRLLVVPPGADPGFDRVAADPARSWAPHCIYNIGNDKPAQLLEMIGFIENAAGRVAEKIFLPMQPGDVVETWADIAPLEAAVGYRPSTPLAEGLTGFVAWLREWRAVVAAAAS